jgi:F-type H+-transporting ATPase subunit gamma
MAEALREIKNRIRGIDNVIKITHAMEMISVAKLNPTRDQLLAQRQYFLRIEKLCRDLLSADAGCISHPFLERASDSGKKALCLITSDTGLCSSYNHNIIRLAEDFINRYGQDRVMLFAVGKKGLSYFKRKGLDIASAFTELKGRYFQEKCREILSALTTVFLSAKVREVYVAYTYFESNVRHRPTIEKLLNIEREVRPQRKYIFEPDLKNILEELIPEYILQKMKSMILESFAAEHSARVIAMGQANQNANDLLEDLVLMRNKVRQANITKELMEIISSVEVMR